jgi:ankyrin repeat protein
MVVNQCRQPYYGMGNGDGTLDPVCYQKQDELSGAAWAGDAERIRSLLADGANPNAAAGESIYPLDAAAESGNTEAARVLLDNGADVNRYHAIRGFPLASAVHSGNPEMVELLLSRGANPNLDCDGVPLLHMAKKQRNPEIISLLERAGAVDTQRYEGESGSSSGG